MTKSETDKKYVDRFIQSMENDYEKWTMTVYSGMDGSWHEYRSPDYTNANGRICFGFGLCNSGAWIDGMFRWSLPFGALFNPFSKTSWRFRAAERKMKRYLKSKAHQQYLEELNQSI